MRILILLKICWLKVIKIFSVHVNSRNRLIQLLILMLGFFSICQKSFAQWTNSTSHNTKIVINTNNPFDISSTSDKNGGAFIFWQDNKNGFPYQIYFMHVDASGKISFRADGKHVSGLYGAQENPVCTETRPNTAVVMWKDLTFSSSGNLFVQKIEDNGNCLWTKDGIQITTGNESVSEYSIASDPAGFVYTSFVSKGAAVTSEYKVKMQKISPEGKTLFSSNGINIYSSMKRKSMTSIVPDDSGGAFIFWLDYKNNKSEILAQHVDTAGKLLWGKNPEVISNISHNVITYVVKKSGPKTIYVVWQTQKSDKDMYHQLINYKGKSLWKAGGKLVTDLKGNQINPQVVVSDSSFILSWTNETGNDNDVYIQKFNRAGTPIWNKTGVPVIKYHGEQFGQKMVSDGKNGVIVAWVDRRADSLLANIYAQKINERGNTEWDSLGLEVASNYNSPKSYLSLIPDGNGGAIVIFKNTRKDGNEIYAQKVFNSGTFVSQIIGFKTSIKGDSVRISWYAANERGATSYTIERASQTQIDSLKWDDIDTIESNGISNAASYLYYDVPQITGTLYYRVIQVDTQGNKQVSDISRVNYFAASSNVVVAQNAPNPFSDSTVISFYLPDSASVTVDFFDFHIDKISEIDKSFPAGKNKIVFYSKGLSPGIYFYRFKVGKFVDVKKMVITN